MGNISNEKKYFTGNFAEQDIFCFFLAKNKRYMFSGSTYDSHSISVAFQWMVGLLLIKESF